MIWRLNKIKSTKKKDDLLDDRWYDKERKF